MNKKKEENVEICGGEMLININTTMTNKKDK